MTPCDAKRSSAAVPLTFGTSETHLGEPETNLVLGRLDGIGTVADVASDIDGVVAADWGRS